MAEYAVKIRLSDLQPVKDLIGVLSKHIDSLPDEVVEYLLEITKEAGNEADQELQESHSLRP
jgi:hypothetical protein